MNYLYIVLFFFVISSCSLKKEDMEIKLPKGEKANNFEVTKSSKSISFDCSYIVTPLKQSKSNTCWATVFKMLYSYKTKETNITIENLLKKYGGLYLDIYTANQGISQKDELELFEKAKITVLKSLTPSVEEWNKLLKDNGPLIVTVCSKKNSDIVHKILMTSMKGDGTPNSTKVGLIDPTFGEYQEKSISEFIELYENASNAYLQICYWP